MPNSLVLAVVLPAMSELGSWLCENARTLGGDRTSYSLMTVFAVKRANALNLENELKNVILAEFRSFAFLRSQGQHRASRRRLPWSALGPKADITALELVDSYGPADDIAGLA